MDRVLLQRTFAMTQLAGYDKLIEVNFLTWIVFTYASEAVSSWL
jgi:hypothetical protein